MAASMERSKDPYEMGFLIAPRVPHGLAAVVESLTREVLRQRPEDIYVFAARHFEKLLTLRERYDVGKSTAGSDYTFYNTIKRRGELDKESRRSKRATGGIGTSSGWSLNETAKVLERHRNIFGDGEKRISTDEVRALANETNGRSGTKGKREKRRSNGAQEYTKDSIRRTKTTTTTMENNDSTKLDRSAKTLKIMSQIPTVLTRNSGTKDIKMELRKNRLGGSLREKSTDSSNESRLPERSNDVSRKSLSKAEQADLIQKFEEERLNRKTIPRSGSVERNFGQSGRTRRRKGSFSELPLDRNELAKTRSMDQVKDYVVRTFASTQNIDELELDYVERVQDVIDRNVPIIRDKLEDLKNDVLTQTSKRAIDRSICNVERPGKRGSRPNTSESDGRRSIENQEGYRSKRSSSVDSMAPRRQQDDTLEARLVSTQNILEDISSICYPKSQSVVHRSRSSNGQSNDQENGYSTSDGDSKITLPAVRPSSSKSSRSLSRNESDNLILPPISPDTAKIPKKKNDTTLPTLSSASPPLRADEKETESTNEKNGDLGKEILELSTSIKEDISSTRKMLEGVNDVLALNKVDDEDKLDEGSSSKRVTTNGKQEDLLEETIEKFGEVFARETLQVGNVEEIFKDSLNVTPDIVEIPLRPDSLEPQLDEERPATADSHLSTVDEGVELKQKLIEIQEIERNVEKAIASFDNSITKEDIKTTEDLAITESKESRKTPDTDREEEESPKDQIKSIDDTNEVSDRSKNKPESESNYVDAIRSVAANDEAIKSIETEKSEICKSGSEVDDAKGSPGTSDEREIDNTRKNSSSSSKGSEEEKEGKKDSSCVSLPSSPKEVPFSYILTEGSPVEIPEFVTTVIIPDRPPTTPELDLEYKEDVELREERRKRAVESFGEYIRPEPIECSTVDIDFIRGIKAGHDIAIVRQDLDGIKEEEEEGDNGEKRTEEDNEVVKKEIKRDRTPVLEHISENEENDDNEEKDKKESQVVADEKDDTDSRENVIESENSINDNNNDITENANIIENSVEGEESTETPDVTSDSTNEVKETTITDRSSDSSSLDPARPIVPELNLDSLRDITVSSFKMNDADATVSLTEPMSSDKEKRDGEQNLEARQEENFDSGRKEDTSAMETISTDEKPMEVEPGLTDLENEEINKEEVVDIANEESEEINKEEVVGIPNKENEEINKKEVIETSNGKSEEINKEEMVETLNGKSEEISKEEMVETLNGKSEEISKEEVVETLNGKSEEINKEEVVETVNGKSKEINKEEVVETVNGKSEEISKEEMVETLNGKSEEISKEEVVETVNGKSEEISKEEVVETVNGKSEEINKEEMVETLNEKSKEISKEEMVETVNGKSNEINKEEVVDTPKEESKEIDKEEVVETVNGKSIVNEKEHSVSPSEKKDESVLADNVEQRDTVQNVATSSNYLGLEENTADLDTEEEIAKELIEIDRAENPPVSREARENESQETLDSNSGDREKVWTIVETSTREEEGKREDVATSPKVGSLVASVENLREAENAKDTEDRIISGGVESRRSSGNEKGKDQSNGSPEDNERSDTSVTAFEREEVKECGVDTKLGEKKEYHVYVTEFGQSESQDDDTESSSTTFHSAATKIQAGVRGFLTRRRLRESNRQGSTLDSVPSIKESLGDESSDVNSKSDTASNSPVDAADESTARSEKVTDTEEAKENVPLTRTVPMPAKSRQCLRREDAMQRNTLSTENAFASSGVQHTGEFHDCLPLPVLESIEIPRRSNDLSRDEDDDDVSTEESIERQTKETGRRDGNRIDSFSNPAVDSKDRNDYESIENIDPTPVDFVQDLNNLLGGLHPKDFAKLLTGQASTPIVVGLIDIAPDSVLGTSPNVIFERNANLNVKDDENGRERAVKDDSVLQKHYLNFITSVEDDEPSHVKNTTPVYKDHSNDHSMQSLREPLALPGTPEGIVIEELGSLDSRTLSKLQDASFNPTSLESATTDRESIEKSITDSEKSIELSEKSNDEDVQIPTTLRTKGSVVDDRQTITKESVSSNESGERIESAKNQQEEEKVEKESLTVETKDDRLIDDDKDDDKSEEIIESSHIEGNDGDRSKKHADEAKEESKGDQISTDDNDNDSKESLSSEIKESDSEQNTQANSKDKEFNKDENLDPNDDEKVNVKRSSVEKVD